MNKKGFAISVILYSIIFLIIIILFILLGIIKTRYTVSDALRNEIVDEINNIVLMESSPSNYSCEIEASSSDYATDLTLRVIISGDSSNCKYSWNGTTYTNSNSILVDNSGIYTAYFKDREGKIGSCSANIISKTVYRSRSCSNNNKLFSDWYMTSEECDNSCTELSKTNAETNGSSIYRTCTTDSNLCSNSPYYFRKSFSRSTIGCNWSNETSNWSVWSDEKINSTSTTQVEFVASYKMA